MTPPLPIIAIVGPTATGKSDLGIALAHSVDGEIVNADASQFYRGMDIGTAKLTLPEREGVPHHLLDVLDVHEEANVAAYQQDAREVIAGICERGRVPILVGGSGLYVRAALDDLRIPPTDPAVRARWEARLDAVGAPALHAQLASSDAPAAQQIHPSNGRRIVRALEVIELTGEPFSATMPTREFVSPAVMLGLQIDRPTLHDRIGVRIERMWHDGLLDEVRGLDRIGLREGRTASRAIGYAQALQQLDGILTETQAQAETATLTRKFARRQQSWFGPDPRIHWLPYDAPDLLDRALATVRAAAPASGP
ncbi:tRNA dimethylallyltransferase [Flexivirga endophytica]|uniref:tRNA dimethylallyltransferase n=1 Tax=Flexivirga endophytica TaxID=1849103 RepID=A0A916SUT1_9MICO|nr:tRNA (adenosine(37)-N6)-dimethylallyltransferase MiaA [Flexivirga endophytica]GGB17564.1 tRNA dimethylallyltransferase [Flexivirga endophytica]GHB38081.1 tRNA dimethylallyltransferase [Flexivirga endophytica]